MSVHKDAFLAFSESARIFIHYLSATANDICKESKRQTINADDVLTALQEIEFSHFLGPLKASLHGQLSKSLSLSPISIFMPLTFIHSHKMNLEPIYDHYSNVCNFEENGYSKVSQNMIGSNFQWGVMCSAL